MLGLARRVKNTQSRREKHLKYQVNPKILSVTTFVAELSEVKTQNSKFLDKKLTVELGTALVKLYVYEHASFFFLQRPRQRQPMSLELSVCKVPNPLVWRDVFIC